MDFKFRFKLGIIIPYLENSEQAKKLWHNLEQNLREQLKHRYDTFIYVVHDNIEKPKGISYCRNKGIEKLIDLCDYLIFLDSDDDIDSDYIEKMVKATETGAELLESRFQILSTEIPFEEHKLKNHITAIAIRSDIIGENRFDETAKFAEDKEFVDRVLDINKMKKIQVDTVYHYNYGYNPDCISYRYSRGEL